MKLDINDRTEVVICVNGRPLPEYRDQEDRRARGNVALSYVEVTSGTNFSVHIGTDDGRLRSHDHAIRYTVSLDGNTVTARNIKRFDRDGSARGQSIGCTTTRDGQEMMMRYQFGDLMTDDEQPQDLDSIDFKRLGEIQVTVYVVRLVSKPGAKAKRDAARAAREHELPAPDIISEKCLKGRAISHVAKFGQPEILRRRYGRASERTPYEEPLSVIYPYGKNPFASFIFKYRSERDLQIEGIIPRDPSPSPTLAVPLENITVEMAREVIRRHEIAEQASEGNLNWPKSEDDTVTMEGANPYGVFGASHRGSNYGQYHSRGYREVKVIDLTGDD